MEEIDEMLSTKMNADEEEEVMKELAALQEELVSRFILLSNLAHHTFQTPKVTLPEVPVTEPVVAEPEPGIVILTAIPLCGLLICCLSCRRRTYQNGTCGGGPYCISSVVSLILYIFLYIIAYSRLWNTPSLLLIDHLFALVLDLRNLDFS
jgi:hypothetical protein